MNWHIVWAILRKEALDTVRDKRTLVMMLGVPIVLYPALMLLVTQVAMQQQTSLQRERTRVAFADSPAPALKAWVQEDKRVEVLEAPNPMALLETGDLEVIIAAPADLEAQLEARAHPTIELRYDATELRSREGADRISELMRKQLDRLHGEWMQAANLREGQITPFIVDEKNVATPKKRSGTLLGLTLPTLLIIMLAIGAFYPAVDLTAGEKERGTFETLLSTPCTKLEIVTGKFATVFGLSLITALLNFGSMAATLFLVISQARNSAADPADTGLPLLQVDAGAIAAVLLVLIPLALFISAVMMSIAVFARSFKEAQNYVTPFMLLIVTPAMVAVLPGVKLSGITAVVPIANIVLLFKDLMTGQASIDNVFVVLLSTSVFAGLALLFAAWLFQREDIVLGGGASGLAFRRASLPHTGLPSPGLAFGAFFTVLVLIMYLGTLAQSWSILPGLLITEYGLILAPCLVLLWYFRVDFRVTLPLRRVSPAQLLGALLCGLGGLIFVIQVGAWHNKILPVPQELQEAFSALFASGGTPLGLATLLFCVALTPAICEEVLFRGVLFAGFKNRMPGIAAVLLVGFLFGVFHLSIHRFASTALLGVLLTYLIWRTGSLLPGMLVHFFVNATSILLATGHIPENIVTGLHLDTAETNGVWWPLLAVAGVALIAGLGLLELPRRRLRLDGR